LKLMTLRAVSIPSVVAGPGSSLRASSSPQPSSSSVLEYAL
jgi:hypothetical protein